MAKRKAFKIQPVNQPNSNLLPLWIGQKVLSKLKGLTSKLSARDCKQPSGQPKEAETEIDQKEGK